MPTPSTARPRLPWSRSPRCEVRMPEAGSDRRRVLSGTVARRTRPSLTDVCVQALTDAIEQGVYQPGSPLPSETDLAEQLEVSRATLREALRTLEDRQLIIRRHGRGTFV